MALVLSYLRAIAGGRRLLVITGAAQIVFLVLFSYAFFLEGFTGLTITLGAIVTLFVLMQATASVSWNDVLAPKAQAATAGGDRAARRSCGRPSRSRWPTAG